MKKGTRIVGAAAIAALAAASLGMGAAAQAASVVTIYGGFGTDQAAAFQAELDKGLAGTGVTAKFTALASFDTDITTKIAGGQEPDIAMWPQPGGLLKQKSKLIPLSDITDLAPIQKTLIPGWDKLAVSGGKIYGLPVSANIKSLIFFNPVTLNKLGLSDGPKTDAELQADEKLALKAGINPWCAGIESGGATGWPATDWMEEYALKFLGSDYNKWWQGQVKWSDPRVVKAGNYVAARLLAKGQVQGGGKAIAARNFGLAETAGLFATGGAAKGQCLFLKQGSFITSFFPQKIQDELAGHIYTHVNVVPVPAPAGSTPGVLGGGDVAAAFHNTAAVKTVLNFILSDKLGTFGMAKAGQLTSAHKTFASSNYPNPLSAKMAGFLAKATNFGFDGSDLAPPAVNKAEWTELTNWFAGKETMKKAFSIIDAAYNN